jgi:hypothetical protein
VLTPGDSSSVGNAHGCVPDLRALLRTSGQRRRSPALVPSC